MNARDRGRGSVTGIAMNRGLSRLLGLGSTVELGIRSARLVRGRTVFAEKRRLVRSELDGAIMGRGWGNFVPVRWTMEMEGRR